MVYESGCVQSLDGEWSLRQAGSQEWIPAQVPGGVHTDLLAAGRIPDPFVADNESRVEWVAKSDWEFRRQFDAAPGVLSEDYVFLTFDGLDTLAEISLNGQVLGQTENMFRRFEWEVKSLLRSEGNELQILFRSPVEWVLAQQEERPLAGVSQAIPGGPHLRKAPCQFGWDWGPMLPPIGIWKGVRLEGRSVARLANVHLRQHHVDGAVQLAVQAVVERWQGETLTLSLSVQGPAGASWETQTPLSGDRASVQVSIEAPQLWWPNGYGEQPLYAVSVVLKGEGKVYDRRDYQVGLRTIELLRQADQWGESFTFVVNGVPIFCKGSNWIPADSFPTRISDEYMEHLIRSAAETHQNMLRVWGGGLYEEERFYDLCDRYGLLVWQDFTFSCSIYPMDDNAFMENVRVEVIENVRRLRHRASLALWCGNNEMEMGWVSWRWDRPEHQDLKDAYDRFFHRLLPEWCAVEDPDHAYWPSSPSSGIPFDDPDGHERGDAHFWGVWHQRMPFTAYRRQYPRFMSEFGFQSLPPFETIQTYAEPEDWNLTSYIMEYHQRGNHGNGLIVSQMTETFRMPKDFSSLVYLSMVLQAEGIRYGVEHWRRAMERVSGTIYWQLNDCWPVASWASIDSFGRWKALHYAARRFYAPLLLSVEDDGTWMAVHVTSDLTVSWQGTLRWALETLDGTVIVDGQEMVSAAPLASTKVCTLDFVNRLADKVRAVSTGEGSTGKPGLGDAIFVCELWDGDLLVSRCVTGFVPPKHVSLVEPGLKVEVEQQDDQLVVCVTPHSLARFVELSLDGVDVVFSDNYFDVPAGRTAAVTCDLPEGWSVARARDALRVRSLYDSFA